MQSKVSGRLSSFLNSGPTEDNLTSAENASPGKSESNQPEDDKLSYPSDAESEELDVVGGENSSGVEFRSSDGAEEQGQREPILSDDILCAVCAEVFLEPCTLHCGHSFCQLCLAALWKSSRKKSPLSLSCPVCRQPWVNFPGVNIQLRNIIEKTHSELVAKRRTCHSDSDEALLLQFKKAVDGDWRRERQQNRQQQLRPVLGVVIVALLGCALITIFLAMISIFALSGSSDDFVHKPVERWSNEDVMDWLKGLGEWASSSNISNVFAKEKISGAQLKLLNASSLKSLGIHVDFFKSQSLLIALEKLKQKEYVQPRNFNEYMRVHRKQTVLVGVLYKFWPRFTILYLFFFEYEDLFFPLWQYSASSISDPQWNTDEFGPSMQQLWMFLMELLLVPHYVVGLFAWQWFSEHPWLCTAVIIHCLWTTQSEAKKTVSFIMTLTQINWRLKFSQTVRVFFKSMFKFVAALSGGLVMWPIMPYFMCTGLFYLVVWNTVYTQLLTVPWRWINARRQRVNLQHALP